MALALQEYEDGLCSGCGSPMDESMDPAAAKAYVAHDPVRCHACTARSAKVRQYADESAVEALRFPVGLKPGVSRAYSVESGLDVYAPAPGVAVELDGAGPG